MEKFLKCKMLVQVKIFPNSKKEKIVKKPDDKFEIRIKEKPIKGLATQAAIKVLADYFKIPQSKIKLVKGFKQRNKIFKINA